MAISTGMSEKQIENTILNWLEWKGIFAWKTKTVGTFDVRSGRFLKGSKLYRKGVSDIIGILPDSKLFAIEVKSKKGYVQPHQKEFIEQINNRGGLAFVARSIDDVEEKLDRYLKYD